MMLKNFNELKTSGDFFMALCDYYEYPRHKGEALLDAANKANNFDIRQIVLNDNQHDAHIRIYHTCVYMPDIPGAISLFAMILKVYDDAGVFSD